MLRKSLTCELQNVTKYWLSHFENQFYSAVCFRKTLTNQVTLSRSWEMTRDRTRTSWFHKTLLPFSEFGSLSHSFLFHIFAAFQDSMGTFDVLFFSSSCIKACSFIFLLKNRQAEQKRREAILEALELRGVMETSIVFIPQILDLCLKFQVRNRLMDSDTMRQVVVPQLSMKIQTHLWVFLALIQIHVLNNIWETQHVSKQKWKFAVGCAAITKWKFQMPKIKSKSLEIYMLMWKLNSWQVVVSHIHIKGQNNLLLCAFLHYTCSVFLHLFQSSSNPTRFSASLIKFSVKSSIYGYF